ncbi:hypothetical protein [Fischerella sp. FACHB-380]|nr:hypothetical protein [Fischerella sp. FACHB-380]
MIVAGFKRSLTPPHYGLVTLSVVKNSPDSKSDVEASFTFSHCSISSVTTWLIFSPLRAQVEWNCRLRLSGILICIDKSTIMVTKIYTKLQMSKIEFQKNPRLIPTLSRFPG